MYSADKLYHSKFSNIQFEISKIEIKGCKFLPESDLLMMINSHETKRSTPGLLLNYYEDNFKKNSSTPKLIKSNLHTIVERYKDEISFYNQTIVEDDVASIKTFYNTNGFHDVKVEYSFFADTLKRYNILQFNIKEGKRYRIKTFQIIGLDSLPINLRQEIQSNLPIGPADFFNEELILKAADLIYYRLINMGYFYAKYHIPAIQIDTSISNLKVEKNSDISGADNYGDYVKIVFESGKRQTIGKAQYIDDVSKGLGIASNIKDKFNLLKAGEWYKYDNVKQTEKNFNALEIFEKIIIDTFDISSPDTLNFKIFTKLRARNKFDYGLFVNHTPNDNYVNTGFLTKYVFLNPFGAGEELNFYANLTIKNINEIFSSKNIDLEGKFGSLFSQPLLWVVDRTQIAFATNIEYSRNNFNGFIVDRWLLPKLNFPIRLPLVQFFNKIQFEISLEGEQPINYNEYKNMKNIFGDELDSLQKAIFYETLDKYWNSENRASIWSAAVIGGTFLSEHRDFPLSPKKGNFSLLSLEAAGLLGVAEYLRFQFTHLQFISKELHTNKVHAIKAKFGIIVSDRNSQDKYVPFDKQFFSGGANSNRGWPARQLHSSNIIPVRNSKPIIGKEMTFQSYELNSNLYGSSGLFEFSYEYRYNFKAPNGISRVIANQISSFGLVGFVDIGNAYGWFKDTLDKAHSNSLKDLSNYYLGNIAYSAGIGLRYETPIGPLRLDFGFPIYGPIPGKPNFILNRYYVLEDIAIHFGIGHSF